MQIRPGRWLYAAVAVSLVLGGVGAWWWGRPQRSCVVPEQELARVWDEARREELRQAFLATRQPYAGSTWRSVEQQLGRYLQGWREAYQQACEATRVRGEQSEQVLGLRLRCLERRRKEVAAQVEVLTSLQGEELVQGSRAPERLTPLAVCMDMMELAASERLPEEPSLRARVEQLQERLVQLNALLTAGRYAQGLEQATALTEAAEATGFQPLIAEAWLLVAQFQYLGSTEGAAVVESAHRAARAALASGYMQGVAQAWIELVSGMQLVKQIPMEEQERWIQYLESSLSAAGNPPSLRALAEQRMAYIRSMQRQHTQALVHARRAVVLNEQLYGAESPQVAAALLEQARAAGASGAGEEGLVAAQRGMAIWKALAGMEHPSTLRMLFVLGFVQTLTGRLADSAATHEQILALHERLSLLSEEEVISVLINLGVTYFEQRRDAEATRLLERSLALLDGQQARASRRAAVALQNLAEMKSWTGRHAEALELAREGWALAQKVVSPTDTLYSAALTTLGEAELGAGQVSPAIATLERALPMEEARPEKPHRQGRVRFALARALYTAGKERPRVLALLEQARQDFDKAGASASRQRDRLEAWLQEQKLERPQR